MTISAPFFAAGWFALVVLLVFGGVWLGGWFGVVLVVLGALLGLGGVGIGAAVAKSARVIGRGCR